VDALVSFLTRRARGGVTRRDTQVSGDPMRFGRGTDCEVFLPDPRVANAHAEITLRTGGPHIEALGDAELRVNGNRTRAGTLKVGDVVGLGPYDIILVQPEGTANLAITVELARPLGDVLASLQARSRTSLNDTFLSRRGFSWAGFAAVVAIFFVLPIVAFFATPNTAGIEASREQASIGGLFRAANASWSAGEISGPHKFFGATCTACHQEAFVRVEDKTCTSCHAEIQHHADPVNFKVAELDSQRCVGCHQEHMGNTPATIKSEAYCADCHADLKTTTPNTTLANAGPFGQSHPQFRPTIPVDEAGRLERVSLSDTPAPAYQSNLKFPHDKHLRKDGIRVPSGPVKKLECASCHKPDQGGVGMLPVAFDSECAECHQNHFDPASPEATVPHGSVNVVLDSLKGFYAAKGLAGGVPDPDAPVAARRVPGTPLPGVEAEARLTIVAWATKKAEKASHVVFSKQGCAACHTVKEQDKSAVVAAGNLLVANTTGGNWQIMKVNAVQIFMPKAVFNHASHTNSSCVSCHAAETSASNSDLLMPKMESCATCHGPEKASDKVPSTCVSCHGFHQPGLPPMNPEAAAAHAAAKSAQMSNPVQQSLPVQQSQLVTTVQ